MFEKKRNNLSYSIKDYFDSNKKYSYQTLRDTIYDLPEETDNSNILNHTSSKCKLVDKNSIKRKMV
ncbi:hypothetical protein J6T66_06255 [bacterium]|nr:hypothetical protein [bacterium]